MGIDLALLYVVPPEGWRLRRARSVIVLHPDGIVVKFSFMLVNKTTYFCFQDKIIAF